MGFAAKLRQHRSARCPKDRREDYSAEEADGAITLTCECGESCTFTGPHDMPIEWAWAHNATVPCGEADGAWHALPARGGCGAIVALDTRTTRTVVPTCPECLEGIVRQVLNSL